MNRTALSTLALFTLAPAAVADYYAVSNDLTNNIGSIVRTDDSGNVKQVFGQGILNYPISIAFRNGELYVGEYTAGVVHRFTANGTYLGQFAAVPDLIGSIVFHPDGSLLVARYEGGAVFRYDTNGNPMPNFIDDTGLIRHGQMAVDASGNVYVSSWLDATIQKYDGNGTFLGNYSDYLTNGLGNVIGLLFDANGEMTVSDISSYALRRLDVNGNIAAELGTASSEPEFLSWGADGTVLIPRFWEGTVHKHLTDGTDLGVFAVAEGTYQMEFGPEVVVPDDVSVHRGRVDSGDTSSLSQIDGSSLRVCRFVVLSATDPPVQVTVRGHASTLNPSSLTVTMSSHMLQNGVFRQELVLIDGNGSLSSERRTDPIGQNPMIVQLSPSVPSDFVAADGTVAVRYIVRQAGPTSTLLWCHEADEVSWTLAP
jgi:streptogramin lyase